MQNCCTHKQNTKSCTRQSDYKIFKLPRKFSKKQCLTKPIKGFTMRSSCAPYKDCLKGGKRKTKNNFLFNPDNPDKSFDVYIDKNPDDTIPIKYTTVQDVKDTIIKLENLYKNNKYTHKRIWQVGMILYVRLRVVKSKKYKQFILAKRYFKFLGERTKIKDEYKRHNLKFNI